MTTNLRQAIIDELQLPQDAEIRAIMPGTTTFDFRKTSPLMILAKTDAPAAPIPLPNKETVYLSEYVIANTTFHVGYSFFANEILYWRSEDYNHG